MKKTAKIADNFTYMHPNEAAIQEYEAQRFGQICTQQSQSLNSEQAVVMALLAKVLFPNLSNSQTEYQEERAAQFRQLLRRHTEVEPINLKNITATMMRKILDDFHAIISGGASNANRTSLMQNMVGDYSIKRLLHRVKAYRESPSFYSELQAGSESVKHQAINLRACGFHEKAKICDKHMSRYFLLESAISSALEQLPEEEVIATITSENGIQKLMNKLKFSSDVNLAALQERFEKIKPTTQSGPFDVFAGMSQMRDLLPNDLPEISEKSHQRANYLITNQFTKLEDFLSWQRCLAPVYFMYAHPHMIDSKFKSLVEQINLACQRGQDPIKIAAWAHCKFQEIHPYVVANKRTSRVLMNLILALHDIPVQEFTTPLEIHAYSVALFQTLFHATVAEQEKSQYNESAFYEFLKNKIALANDNEAWTRFLQNKFLPKYERDVGLAKDISEILTGSSNHGLCELIMSIKSYLQQKAPTDFKALPSVPEQSGVSFFKPKTNYAKLKIVKHNLPLQKQAALVLDAMVVHLNIKTITTEGTERGWRVFNTAQEGCFMAQVDCCALPDQQQLQAYLNAKLANVIVTKSKQETYIARIFFHDIKELDVLKAPAWLYTH